MVLWSIVVFFFFLISLEAMQGSGVEDNPIFFLQMTEAKQK